MGVPVNVLVCSVDTPTLRDRLLKFRCTLLYAYFTWLATTITIEYLLYVVSERGLSV